MSAGEALPRAHGAPVLRARIRERPEDFAVTEVLGFEPSGSGEHLFVEVEKRGANTAWVAAELARWAGIREADVGYAGLKDRHAVTRQAFTLQLPGRDAPAMLPEHAEYRVLSLHRHHRKLQRGALQGNRFALVLRAVAGEPDAIAARLAAIAAQGVPHYFGEQRFGREGGNIERARAMFRGRRLRRDQASILLSAVRSAGFNAILAARVAAGCWARPVEGEVFMLDGSHSVFGPQPLDAALGQRCSDGDIHPTAALWGRGELRSTAVAAAFDHRHGLDDELRQGLEDAGLRQERRATRLPVAEFESAWLDADTLRLAFSLPAGAYATAVLHELGLTEDASSAISGKSDLPPSA